MSWKIDEFFAAVEDEFGVSFGAADREFLATPASVIDYVTEATDAGDATDDDQHREEVVNAIAEMLERDFGVTRWREDWKLEDVLKG